MAKAQSKGGKKARKYGRKRDHSKAQARYRMDSRSHTNKRKKVIRAYKRSKGKDKQAAQILEHRFNVNPASFSF